MSTGSKIIDGLKDAVAGNFTRVHVEGFEWVRADHVASLIAENERLRAELRASDLMYVEMKQERDEAREHCERLQNSNSEMAKQISRAALDSDTVEVCAQAIERLPIPPMWSGWYRKEAEKARAKAVTAIRSLRSLSNHPSAEKAE